MSLSESHMQQLTTMARKMRQRKNCTVYIVRRGTEIGVATHQHPGDILLGVMPSLGKLHEQADALKEQGGSA